MSDPTAKVTITYGDFSFPAPTPYLSRDHENIDYGGDIWGASTNITLNGQIYLYESERGGLGNSSAGADARFEALNNKKNAIITAFSDDFKALTILASGVLTEIGSGCIVQNVSFSDNGYGGIVDYTITLRAYELSSFKANHKVLDPVDRFSFTEGEDGFIQLTHTISAKGFNTNGTTTDAFVNARDFVDNRKGLSNKPTTALIGNAGATPLLVSVSENVDRFGGTYSVTENYRYHGDGDAFPDSNFLTKYTISKSKSVDDGITTVSIEGEIKYKKLNYIVEGEASSSLSDDEVMDELREEFERVNWHNICQADAFSGTDELNNDPVTFSTTEDKRARLFNFSISFDNDTLYSDALSAGFAKNKAYYDFTLSLQTNEATSISTVGLSGSIKSRGSLQERNANVEILLEDLISSNYADLKAEAQEFYGYFIYGTEYKNKSSNEKAWEMFSLTYLPQSVSINKNKFNGTISLSVSFTDRNFYPSYDIIDSDYQVSVTPAMNQYSSKPSCNTVGSYMIYDVNANNREVVGVSVNGKLMQFSSSDISTAKKEFKQIMDKFRKEYVETESSIQRLDSEQFIEGKQDHSLNINSQFSCRKDDSFIKIDRKKE